MRIHRTRWKSGFTVLPNFLLQDRRLSYLAKGILVDLLSRPDGWREDGRHIADSSPTGRGAVARALRELARFGYYRVEKVRQSDGTIISEAHVFDTPQVPVPSDGRTLSRGKPVAGKSGSGELRTGRAAALSKDGDKGPGENPPSLPALHDEAPAATTAPAAPATSVAVAEAEVTPVVREAVSLLFRVLRSEPRLRVGEPEALALAPLVAEWLVRGATERDLADALLPDLPTPLHAPAKLLRNRLTRKRPPTPGFAVPAQGQPPTCGTCAAPTPRPGICRSCAGLGPRTPVGGIDPAIGPSVTARGIARVRAALRSARPTAVAGTCAYGRGALTPARACGSTVGVAAAAAL
ncbi:hypothetical protein [Streptacidiphilus fuscans]|uniref:Helix-turn-helix domain-containing protein n=1 Tax=Streptacidiphilus fuscans TaxID=2789292 RepID=A0A931B839_9ACTN|nr:hypothetical protein [Streptacidiphilus fuscans]MBF9071659.1 hypothetical protein [Streptacidiphilus fuscans]MBF9072854.1 hypothetical protein [Streptacidiphilus fuscans]